MNPRFTLIIVVVAAVIAVIFSTPLWGASTVLKILIDLFFWMLGCLIVMIFVAYIYLRILKCI